MDEVAQESLSPSSSGKLDLTNLEYEDEVDHELFCPICREPMQDPTMTRPCQHIFCTACLHRAFLHQRQQRIAHHCPSCRTEFITPDPEDDPAEMYAEPLDGHVENNLPNRLDALKVRCPNKGCTSIRERFLLPDHIKNHCPHTVFPCYDQSCSQSVERQHMRLHCTHELIECRHCHEWLERYQLADHEGKCPKLESLCSNCEAVFPRDEFAAHQQECEPPEIRCPGLKFGCESVLSDAADLAIHQATCTIARLGETISHQEQLLQAHRDALMTLTRQNAQLENRLTEVENDLKEERQARSEDTRLRDIENQTETLQQQVSERVAKAELMSFNSVQRQGQFNQYMEACLARMQTDLGAMHHALMRGRMMPGPPMPISKPSGEEIHRPGSEGSESVARSMGQGDDLMPPATRTMSATEPSPAQNGVRNPEPGPFASLATLIPNATRTSSLPMPNPNATHTRPVHVQRPRRPSEERSVKL